MKRLVTALMAAALCLAAPVSAQERRSATLEKIRANGTIYVGHREASIPFSYMPGAEDPVGYSIDLCKAVVDRVKEKLGLSALQVVYVPVTSGSRQMMLEAGTIDLECGSVTNTVQRQRYVAFSVTTYVAEVKALVRRDSGIRSVRDMRDKVVVTTSGTTSDGYVKAAAARQGLFLNYRVGRDHDESLSLVMRGQADVMVLDDVLLKGLLLNQSEADAYKVVVLDESFAAEPYALMFRRNDPEFKSLVDGTLVGLMRSGEMSRIYERWFLSPIPPLGKKLDMPMGDLLKQLIQTPNDRGI